MSVQVEVLEHNMAKLTITVPAEKFNAAIKTAYNRMKGQISVPGFRKGKVPQAMVEKMYGAGMFYEEASNIVMPEAYQEALAEVKDIMITSNPAIDIVNCKKGEDFVFTAEVATKPEAIVKEYKGIEVAVEAINVTDEEIEAEIAKVQKQNSRKVTKDTAAEMGDTVNLDYAGTVDGVAFEGGSAEGYDLVLGSGSFIPGFEEQLVGAAAGAEVEVNVTFPEEYHSEDLAGKAAVFACKVNEVTAEVLPELDDEFAQDVSECETIEEYKAEVKAKLEESKKAAADADKRTKVMDQIVENAEIDLPEPMITTQAMQMVDQYAMQLQQSGLSLEMYFQYTGMTKDDLLEQLKPQAEKNIRARLCLEAIAKAEGMEVTAEELDAEYANMAAQYNMEVEKIKEIMGDVDADALKSDLLANKALDLVAATAVEVPVTAVEATVEE